MNTVQLECFMAVAEHLNFSKASQVLKLTQPAVSHQIQTLEEELEVKLFVRTSRSVSLTQEGMLFLADAQLILRTALSAKERLGRQVRMAPFELGCHNHMEVNLLPPVLKPLVEAFPLLRPSIHLIPFPSLLNQVENNQIHVALGVEEAPGKTSLFFKPLFSASVACICVPDHPLARFESLVQNQLAGSFVACSPRQIADSIFTLQNQILTRLPPEQRFFTETIDSVLALVKAGLGYTLYPDIPQVREPGLCYISVTDLPKITFGVYCPQDHSHPVLKRFLSLFAQCFPGESTI